MTMIITHRQNQRTCNLTNRDIWHRMRGARSFGGSNIQNRRKRCDRVLRRRCALERGSTVAGCGRSGAHKPFRGGRGIHQSQFHSDPDNRPTQGYRSRFNRITQRQAQTNESGRQFSPLRITPEPEEVLTRATCNGTPPALHIIESNLPREHRAEIDLSLGHDPHVGAAAPELHRDTVGLGACKTREPPRQHLPGSRPVGQGIDPHQRRSWHDATTLPGRRHGQGDGALGRPVTALTRQTVAPLGQSKLIESGGRDRILAAAANPGRDRRLDPGIRQSALEIGSGSRLPAPPSGRGRKLQSLSRQALRDRRQKTQQRGRLDKS